LAPGYCLRAIQGNRTRKTKKFYKQWSIQKNSGFGYFSVNNWEFRMIKIESPQTHLVQRKYILNVVFQHFLGLQHEVTVNPEADTTIIRHASNPDGAIIVGDFLLGISSQVWLSQESLPQLPLATYRPQELLGFPSDYDVPIIYKSTSASKRTFLHESSNVFQIDFDLFGSCFFLLTRYEEIVISKRDEFDRFAAKDSVMSKAKVLDRPLVDEYVGILESVIKRIWPDLKFKQRTFQIMPTHDVDWPFLFLFMSPYRLLRYLGSNIFRQKDVCLAIQSVKQWARVKCGDYSSDPAFSAFERLFAISEKVGLQNTFYFIAAENRNIIDGDCDIDYPEVRSLLRRIHERGHVIGLHPSFETLNKPMMLKREFERLKEICREEGIEQHDWPSRSHFLRWETAISFRNLEDAGIAVDSTLSFAEHAGFRCGTCHEYPTFDLLTGTPLKLREQPLIAMECSVFEWFGQGLNDADGRDFLLRLREQCRLAKGKFVLLWHNSRFIKESDWEIYETLLSS
jgi:hypothetical protein